MEHYLDFNLFSSSGAATGTSLLFYRPRVRPQCHTCRLSRFCVLCRNAATAGAVPAGSGVWRHLRPLAAWR
jgi:hypothetical protein